MHKSSGGFSGRGFKFDETEAILAAERKKLQKKALGLQDSDDDDVGLDVCVMNSHCIYIYLGWVSYFSFAKPSQF